jgi:double-strand break repair protein MRE11
VRTPYSYDPNVTMNAYSFPAINYEDPNMNVSIPTFSIHGNHDDPQGAGPVCVLISTLSLLISRRKAP